VVSRGVVEADRCVLVGHHAGDRVVVPGRQQVVVGGGEGKFHGPTVFRRKRDDLPQRDDSGQLFARRFQQLGFGEQEHGTGMLDELGDLLGGQPGVDGDQHPAGQRHREVGYQHFGAVRREIGHPVTGLQASGFQCPSKPGDLSGHRRVGEGPRPVGDGLAVRMYRCRTLKKAQWGQGNLHNSRHLVWGRHCGCLPPPHALNGHEYRQVAVPIFGLCQVCEPHCMGSTTTWWSWVTSRARSSLCRKDLH
jgi:hypothetical protein